MNRKALRQIRSQIPVSSIEDLPGFPYKTHREFVQDLNSERAYLWLKESITLFWWVSSLWSKSIFILLFSSGPIISMKLLYDAFILGNLWSLLGLPLIPIGFRWATPNMNLINGCLPALGLIIGMIISTMYPSALLIGGAGFLVYALTSFGQAFALFILEFEVKMSEELTIWLYLNDKLRIDPRQPTSN